MTELLVGFDGVQVLAMPRNLRALNLRFNFVDSCFCTNRNSKLQSYCRYLTEIGCFAIFVILLSKFHCISGLLFLIFSWSWRYSLQETKAEWSNMPGEDSASQFRIWTARKCFPLQSYTRRAKYQNYSNKLLTKYDPEPSHRIRAFVAIDQRFQVEKFSIVLVLFTWPWYLFNYFSDLDDILDFPLADYFLFHQKEIVLGTTRAIIHSVWSGLEREIHCTMAEETHWGQNGSRWTEFWGNIFHIWKRKILQPSTVFGSMEEVLKSPQFGWSCGDPCAGHCKHTWPSKILQL